MNELGGMFVAKGLAKAGIESGELHIVGSVVRYAAGPMKGKIHSYLQETGLVGSILESVGKASGTFINGTASTGNPAAGAAMAATQLTSSLAGNVQNEVIRRGVKRVDAKVDLLAEGVADLQSLGITNLALSATGIGVSLVGFGIMNARLSRVQDAISSLSEQSDRILAAVERIRQDQLDREFLALGSQVRLFEEAWEMTDHHRAAQIWLNVAQNTRVHQDRFEARARELLLNLPPEFELADPMIDALALSGGLRVSCLMACNEIDAARSAASENARQIEALTGRIGKADMVMAYLPAGIDSGSQEWATALELATEQANPKVDHWRRREAVAATRAAPLDRLEASGIAPREWLAAARSEMREPVLMLKAD